MSPKPKRVDGGVPYQKSLILACLIGFLICVSLLIAGCSVKHQQITFAGVQGADLVSTAYAESRGASEGNPVMRGSWAQRIALKSASTALVVWATSKVAKEHQQVAKVVLVTLTAVIAGVAINNVRVGQ